MSIENSKEFYRYLFIITKSLTSLFAKKKKNQDENQWYAYTAVTKVTYNKNTILKALKYKLYRKIQQKM